MLIKKLYGKVLPVFLSAMLVVSGAAAFPMTAFAHEDGECDDNEQWEYDNDDDVYTDHDGCGEADGYSYIVAGCHESTIYVGNSAEAYAEVFSDITGARFSIVWSSQNPGIAQVSGNGESAYIHGVSAGSTTITATFYINDTVADTDSFIIKVQNKQPERIPVNGIAFYQDPSKEIPAGTEIDMWATVLPRNATNQDIHYSSSNNNVATVNGDGVVHGNNSGTAIITAKTCENGYTAQMRVTVTGGRRQDVHVSSVSVNPTAVTLAINQYMYVTPTVHPSDAANTQVGWSSSNPQICSVSTNGKIQGRAPGVAVITCRSLDGNKIATTTVTVANVVAPGAAPAPVAPITATTTRDPMLSYNTTLKILQAAPNATVTISTVSPMSYDTNVAAALQMRPDVTLAATFPFQGHTFLMTLPAKYPLASHLDRNGYIDWLMLCALKDGVVVTIVK